MSSELTIPPRASPQNITVIDDGGPYASRLRDTANSGNSELQSRVLKHYLDQGLTNDPTPTANVVAAVNQLIRSLGADGLTLVKSALQQFMDPPNPNFRGHREQPRTHRELIPFSRNYDGWHEPEISDAMVSKYSTLVAHAHIETSISSDGLTSAGDDIGRRFRDFVDLTKLRKIEKIFDLMSSFNAERTSPSSESSVDKAIAFERVVTNAREMTSAYLLSLDDSMSELLNFALAGDKAPDKIDIIKIVIDNNPGEKIVQLAVAGLVPRFPEIAAKEGMTARDKLEEMSRAYAITRDYRGQRKGIVSEDLEKSIARSANRAVGVIANDASLPVIKRVEALAHAYHHLSLPETVETRIPGRMRPLYEEIGAIDQAKAFELQGSFLVAISGKQARVRELEIFARRLKEADPLTAAKVAWKFLLTSGQGPTKAGADIFAAARTEALNRMDVVEAFGEFRRATREAVERKVNHDAVRSSLEFEGELLLGRIESLAQRTAGTTARVTPTASPKDHIS